MKKLSFYFMLFIANVSCAQKVTWNKVVVDKNSSFTVNNEGKMYNSLIDVSETNGFIKSDVMVNGDTTRRIVYTKSEMKNDTLKIVIHQTDPAYHHTYIILIFKNRYLMDYKFLTSGEAVNRRLKPIQTKLILKRLDFRKGEELRGYAEYKAKCLEGCWEDSIVVKGNFIVTIN
ncbi:MAG: hypothetical protein KF763_10040 [Cyclobacteriaceae bacterium]|nr:hypothetical protein [Cyclobacteriaceae bacterium]